MNRLSPGAAYFSHPPAEGTAPSFHEVETYGRPIGCFRTNGPKNPRFNGSLRNKTSSHSTGRETRRCLCLRYDLSRQQPVQHRLAPESLRGTFFGANGFQKSVPPSAEGCGSHGVKVDHPEFLYGDRSRHWTGERSPSRFCTLIGVERHARVKGSIQLIKGFLTLT